MKRKARWLALGLGVSFVVWRAFVTMAFRAQGLTLVAGADRFPKSYTVGIGHPLRMVVLGDSTAVGVGADTLDATLPYRVAATLGGRVTVDNFAASGAVLADVVRIGLPQVPYGADLVLISVTANDATHGTSPSDTAASLQILLDGLRSRRAKRIVISTTPNFRTTPALPWALNRLFERRAAALSQIVLRVTARRSEVRIADLNREGTLDESQYAGDGFHPNASGYARWAEIFVREIKKSSLTPHEE